MVANVLSWHDQATAQNLHDGQEWYATASASAAAIADASGLSYDTCVGIIAALSPRVRWATNLVWATTIAHARAAGAIEAPAVSTRSNRGLAWRIACGEAPLDVMKGPKTRSFFANIAGDERAVAVDVWAARAAEGYRDERAPTGKRYAAIADAYREAADQRGLSPRDLQACVWVAVRGHAY